MDVVGDEQHWRSQVQEALSLAESLQDHQAKRVTLELALVYGRLAEYAKRRQREKVAAAVELLSKTHPAPLPAGLARPATPVKP
ncbi:MAG: hypothetical protein IT539_17310 [Bradyrhizobiaceae bacterium]|nr:hypothetical protein [Bradyrhizobiaceae bacterium]